MVHFWMRETGGSRVGYKEERQGAKRADILIKKKLSSVHRTRTTTTRPTEPTTLTDRDKITRHKAGSKPTTSEVNKSVCTSSANNDHKHSPANSFHL